MYKQLTSKDEAEVSDEQDAPKVRVQTRKPKKLSPCYCILLSAVALLGLLLLCIFYVLFIGPPRGKFNTCVGVYLVAIQPFSSLLFSFVNSFRPIFLASFTDVILIYPFYHLRPCPIMYDIDQNINMQLIFLLYLTAVSRLA